MNCVDTIHTGPLSLSFTLTTRLLCLFDGSYKVYLLRDLIAVIPVHHGARKLKPCFSIEYSRGKKLTSNREGALS